jgi:hypothetical protein
VVYCLVGAHSSVSSQGALALTRLIILEESQLIKLSPMLNVILSGIHL